MNNNEKLGMLVVGIFLGGLIGSAVALLYAPTSGKKLRKKIADKTDDIIDDAHELYDSSKDKAEELVKEGKKKAAGLIDDAKNIVHNQFILLLAKERKNQIIRAAAKRFSRHGLGKTTLNEIARDVRIGKATIYHYFTSKEDLFYQTLEWEASQFINDIKAIFNNEEIPIGGRLLEYFSYKETVAQKYKLLFDLMLQLFTDERFEIERDILKILIKEEEKIVKLILSSVYSGRIESMDTALPNYVATISWGLMFSNKLRTIAEPARIVSMKDVMFKSLENILS